MKPTYVLLTLLVLAVVLVAAFGPDPQQIALAQNEQPPVSSMPESQSEPQATTPGGYNNLPESAQETGAEILASPSRQMSYQGKLLINSSPCQGSKAVTFRLYTVDTGGTKIWEETQTVSCSNGLFSVMLGKVTPLPLAVSFQSQLWLGIQPAGAAAELTPRQLLGTVPYAMNLQGGATLVDTNPVGGYHYSFYVESYNHQGIYGDSSLTNGVGILGASYGTYSGASSIPTGVYGYSSDGVGVYGSSYGDIGAECDTISNTPCRASMAAKTTTDTYGIYSLSTYSDASHQGRNPFFGVNNTASWYTAYFYNRNTSSGWGLGVVGDTYIGGDLTVSGSKSGYVVDISLNASSEPLERGDVVAVVGVDTPVMGDIPVMRVAKANTSNASAVVGIVDKLYLPCDRSQEELEPGEACGGFVDEAASIQPGQYASVVTLGAYAYLKADASYGAIKAGDLLSISPLAGVASTAQQITVNTTSFYAPGTIIGKALGSLDSGSGYIAVFVSLK